MIYENYEDYIMILRTNLIDVIRDCKSNITMSFSDMELYDKLISYLEEFEDCSVSVRILKPESDMSIGRFYDIFSGIMIAQHYAKCIGCGGMVDANNKKVIFYVPANMLNDILNDLISRIIHHPKSVAISTNPTSNLYMSETFKR